MSGYGPFSWSYGLSVLKTLAEPKWLMQKKADGTAWEDFTGNDKNQFAKPPIASYIGWALLRIALCVDMSLIAELVGAFVLSATHFKSYDFKKTHRDPYAVTFIACVGGALSTILIFVIDVIYSKPEKRPRYAMMDPNKLVGTTGYPIAVPYKGTAGDKDESKNWTEGGPITLKKLRYHALMRVLIWPLIAISAGGAGTALWHSTQKNSSSKRMGDAIITGIVVELVGMVVVVVGPSIVQILSLTAESVSPPHKASK